MSTTAPLWINIIPLINLILLIAILSAGIYGFVLFVRFARLGIKAFTIYIEKNRP